MYLKNLHGKIVYECRNHTIKECLYEAVQNNIDLTGVNLRKANLSGIHLYRGALKRACFWGANLKGARIINASLSHCDFRFCNFDNSFVQNCPFNHADFRGAIFKELKIKNNNFSNCRISNLNIIDPIFDFNKKTTGVFYFDQNGNQDFIKTK